MSSLWWVQLHVDNTILDTDSVSPEFYEYVAAYAYTHKIPHLYSVFSHKLRNTEPDKLESIIYKNADPSFYDTLDDSSLTQIKKLMALIFHSQENNPGQIDTEQLLSAMRKIDESHFFTLSILIKHSVPFTEANLRILALVLPIVDKVSPPNPPIPLRPLLTNFHDSTFFDYSPNEEGFYYDIKFFKIHVHVRTHVNLLPHLLAR